MVDVVDECLLVHEAHEVLHDLDNVLLGKDERLHVGIHLELAVDLIATYLTQVVPFVREEQLVDDTTRRIVIWRIGTTELLIDIIYRLHLRAGGVFSEGVVDDRIIFLYILAL